jgi:unsaturated chondroitin disaccharide hydrolase
MSDWAIAALQDAEKKVIALAERHGGAFIHAAEHGRYVAQPADWWTSGFWPGLAFLVYRRSDLDLLRQIELVCEDELERVLLDERVYGLHHDVGFQFMPTAVARYKLTGDPVARRRGFLAAALLMSRFNPAGGFLEAWNGEQQRGFSIIDSMMNLPLLYWAAEEFGLARFRNVADAHAAFAMRHAVRADGSTNHILHIDPRTGELIKVIGGQGLAPDSRWSRGQAWALYGFALAARHTGTPAYLTTACKIAENFIASLPERDAPPWDFAAPGGSDEPRDSSAGAIAASGLLELARLLPPEEGMDFSDAGERLLRTLYDTCFSADEREDGLLLHATGNRPASRDVDVSLIYGDFYFVEALGKLAGETETCW